MPRASRKKGDDISEERIVELFLAAEQLFTDNHFQSIPEERRQAYADRYVELARKISMKAQKPIPGNLKKRFCKHCYAYLRPGINSRTRTRDGKLVTYCTRCKRFMRKEMKNEEKDGTEGKNGKSSSQTEEKV